jgi:hypothetical protein
MVSPVTHLRRSLHAFSPGGGREVAITSWYDTRFRTWRATCPDYPYIAETRPRATPEISLTRREAVGRLLASLDRSVRQSQSLVKSIRRRENTL